MKKLALILSLVLATPAWAANVNIDGLPAASSANTTDLYECEQSGVNNQCTGAQLKTLINTSAVDARTTTTEAIANSDQNKLVTFSNAGAVACSIAQAGTGGNFAAGWAASLKNQGAGTVTCTATTSTIDGNATLVLTTGQGVDLYSDGANYFTQPGQIPAFLKAATQGGNTSKIATESGSLTSGNYTKSDASGNIVDGGAAIGALGTVSPGANVATAAAAALSAAGGLTSTIASGTSALGTGAITSATCATVVTTTATNTATTDVVLASFNGDPTAVTGYIPATAGMLTIIAYPTSGNVNFKVCNNTASPITPGAITLNWRVVR